MNERKLTSSIDKAMIIRIICIIILDVVLINLVSFLALYIRFDFSYHNLETSGFLEGVIKYAPFNTVFTVLIFVAFRLYTSLWEFVGISEMIRIGIAVAISTAVNYFLMIFAFDISVPRSYPLFSCLLLGLFMAAERVVYRVLRRIRYGRGSRDTMRRTLLVGAGRAGAMVLKDCQTSEYSINKVVCVADDDPLKRGQYLMGVKIGGNRHSIPMLAKKYKVQEIILAVPTAHAEDRREIIKICQETGCKLRTIPAMVQLASGAVDVKTIRDVDVEDLLGRDPVEINIEDILGYIEDKTVLVTGGGGSIGSELSRQVAAHKPKRLIIFDIYENNAYHIQQELKDSHPELDMKVLVGSVRDKARVEELFETYRPEIVYHAAAHKHVPLMEESPHEAIKNNVFGTLNVAEAADKYGSERFVLISTDKAVNPTSIMGATKRVCEMIIQTVNARSKTVFAAVRFGNVLGSNGSVIPLFKKQIEAGGPVTVTHRDIIRYFMTIPEAVSLILQAGAYAAGGEIFVLDMGDPVRIDDLARNMIRLSGFEPDVDIEVVYTGLRPGEKLYEELLLNEEGLGKTANELIYIGKPVSIDEVWLAERLKDMWEALGRGAPRDELRAQMHVIVPEFSETPKAKKPEQK